MSNNRPPVPYLSLVSTSQAPVSPDPQLQVLLAFFSMIDDAQKRASLVTLVQTLAQQEADKSTSEVSG